MASKIERVVARFLSRANFAFGRQVALFAALVVSCASSLSTN